MIPENETRRNVAGDIVPEDWKQNIIVIWIGQAFSIVSSSAAGFAAMWYITETTGSPLMLSLGAIFVLLPMGILSPFGGIIADRYDRKKVIMISDLSVGVISIILGLVVLFGVISLPLLLVVLMTRSCAQAFHSPAMTSLMPLMVPEKHLVRINALDQALVSASAICGPVIGIFLYTAIGFEAVLFLDAICAIIACICLAIRKAPKTGNGVTDGKTAMSELKDGLQYIKTDRGLFQLFVVCTIIMIVSMPVGSLFPMMTYDVFSGTGYQASLIEAIWGVGMLIGSLVLVVWGGFNRLMIIVFVSGLGVGITTMLCGLLQESQFNTFVILTGIMAFAMSLFAGPIMPIMQKRVPQEKMGRIMGLYITLATLASPIGLVFAGIFAEKIGISMWFFISGAALCIVVAVAIFFKDLRQLDNFTNL